MKQYHYGDELLIPNNSLTSNQIAESPGSSGVFGK